MNQDTFIAAMASLRDSLLIGWRRVGEFGYDHGQINSTVKICNARERRMKAKRFELMLSEERGKLYSILLSRLGLSTIRGVFRDQLDKSNDDVVNLAGGITNDIEGTTTMEATTMEGTTTMDTHFVLTFRLGGYSPAHGLLPRRHAFTW